MKIIMPYSITILLVIMGSLNFQIYGLFAIMPFFAAISIFYWRVYSPQKMDKIFVFFLGIFQDILYSSMIGSTSLLLLAFLWFVRTQRNHLINQSFWIIWLVFAVAISLFSLANWGINSLLLGVLIMDSSIIFQAIISILIYPVLFKLFKFIDSF